MPVKVLFCYAHEDETLLNKLKTHLKPLQRQEIIDLWHDRDISAGAEWERDIDKHLNTADIILLLVSSDFMNSDYCYSVEMKRAMERQECGEAYVLAVILRPVLWENTPIEMLQILPTNKEAVVKWRNRDHAFEDIARGINKILATRPITEEQRLKQKQHLEEKLGKLDEQILIQKESFHNLQEEIANKTTAQQQLEEQIRKTQQQLEASQREVEKLQSRLMKVEVTKLFLRDERKKTLELIKPLVEETEKKDL